MVVCSSLAFHGCRSGVAAKSIKTIAKMVDVRRSGFELACDRFETDAFATSLGCRFCSISSTDD